MGQHRLPNGRDVSLVRFTMRGTYSGVLEGSALTASQVVRESLPERAADLLPPGHPLAIIGPPAGELPPWLCVAQLESGSGVRHTDPDYNSRLYVCWFMDDTTRSLDAILDSILPHLDWEGVAEDYNILDF